MGNFVVNILLLATASAVSFSIGVIYSAKVTGFLSRCDWSRLLMPLKDGRSSDLKASLLERLQRILQSIQLRSSNLAECVSERNAFKRKGAGNKSWQSFNQDSEPASDDSLPDISRFNCRANITSDADTHLNIFSVDICGLIDFHQRSGDVTLNISILDISDWEDQGQPVYARSEEYHIERLTPFSFTTALGKLPQGQTTLSDWTVVARLRCDRLWMPRKGKRLLQFICIVTASEDGHELTRADYICEYDNKDAGYLDFEQNCQRATNLGVGLAFAVSASDSKLFNCEIDFIKDWARSHVRLSDTSEKAQKELEKQLDKTVDFFRRGNYLSIEGVCREIVTIAPMAERYDILDLCLRVAQAKGMAASQELAILKDIAIWLQVDFDRFRAMMEKILPVGIHEVEDSTTLLGITDEMSDEQIRQHLTREYCKWNSRVTNPDPQVRKQADQMLKLIAEAREKYATQLVKA